MRDGRINRIPAVVVDTSSRLTGRGLGSVRVGDSYEHVARATGSPVISETLEDGDPTYVALDGGGADLVGGSGKLRSVVVRAPGFLSELRSVPVQPNRSARRVRGEG